MLGPLLMFSAKMGSLLLKPYREFGLSPEENVTIINDSEKGPIRKVKETQSLSEKT